MIHFTGDICLCDKAFDIGFGAGSKIAQGKIRPFEGFKKDNGDVWIGNFEGVVSDTTYRNDYTRDSFRISSETFKKSNSIIDYWGIANNHVMEHGKEAYLQMEQLLSANSNGVFGSNTQRTICFKHQGKQVSVTGFSLRTEEGKHKPQYWHIPELRDIQSEADRYGNVDYRIAYIHWGVEFVHYPSTEQVRFAHWLIDIGYDLVIGMHPHVLQGFEVYKGKYVFYSLGNTIFHMDYFQSRYAAIVSFDVIRGQVSYRYIYINDDFCPEYVEEKDVPEMLRFSSLNEKVCQEKNIEKYIVSFRKGLKAYRKENNRAIVRNIFKFKPKILIHILLSFVKRKLKR